MISLQQELVIKNTVKRYKPTLVGVFGSFARNEDNHTSDLDILIDFENNVNLIELIGLEQELTESLGIKVDLVTLKSVNQNLKSYIEKDLIRIM
jgi:predicted nucleotidyltransferase